MIDVLIALGAAVAAGLVGLFAGRRQERVKREKQDAEAYRDTRRRMDAGGDGRPDLEWLRDRGER